MTVPLNLDEFPAVFNAVHGYAPYRWQMRLLGEVVAKGLWPQVVAAPTAAGKTAALDIALFHLALTATNRPRLAPLRIILAVDRWIIVDKAFERAKRLSTALEGAREANNPIGRMARRLAALSGAEPLHVAELRMGIPRETDWAKRPDQPTILCTTVDQLGSRLFFRGYGVSPAMAAIHAGLLGNDALLILDEPHLSEAFNTTLSAITEHRRSFSDFCLPWQRTSLTATPRDTAGVFALTPDERSEANIRQRLEARKLVRLVSLKNACPEVQARGFADKAHELMAALRSEVGSTPSVAVVVNYVALARAVFNVLHAAKNYEVILLIGRVRPVDRDELVAEWRARLEAGAEAATRPLLVVSTQCIEAGADFDFDGMVTQIAPIDVLRQRFGRLARFGNKRKWAAPGIILATKDEQTKEDSLYRMAPANTWKWLGGENAVIDFGPNALDLCIQRSGPIANCLTAVADAPRLRQVDLDAFAQTSPLPWPDPEPSLFLHGEFRTSNDVSVVWRADLDPFFVAARTTPERDLDITCGNIAAVLELLPPRAGEVLALPAECLRRWLTGQFDPLDRLPDVPAIYADEPSGEGRRILRWRGVVSDQPALIDAIDIAPGDVIVLPSSDGGCDRFGWAPNSSVPVLDTAEIAAKPFNRRQAALRVHPLSWSNVGSLEQWMLVSDAIAEVNSSKELVRKLGELDPSLSHWSEASSLTVMRPYGDDAQAGLVLFAPHGVCVTDATEPVNEPATEEELGSLGPSPISIDSHTKLVVSKVRELADGLGLPEAIAATLESAARWHDFGKADPRFQVFLANLSGRSEGDTLLAKSDSRNPGSIMACRIRASLPVRWRHEVVSVRYALHQITDVKKEGIDSDLLLWLVGTHHGHGRPLFGHDDDWDANENTILGTTLPAAPGPDKLDFDWHGRDWAGLMRALQKRHGVWGLAFLEACLRLADHRAFDEETA